MVGIKGPYRSTDHVAVLAQAFLQPAADEASLVFQLVALGTRELGVLLDGLGCTYGVGISVLEFVPGQLAVLVLAVGLAVAKRNLDELVVHCISFRKSVHAVIG